MYVISILEGPTDRSDVRVEEHLNLAAGWCEPEVGEVAKVLLVEQF